MACDHDYDREKYWLGCPYCEGGALLPSAPDLATLVGEGRKIFKIPCKGCHGAKYVGRPLMSWEAPVYGPGSQMPCPECHGLGGRYVGEDEWNMYQKEVEVTQNRPSFDDVYMHMAQVMALRSTCGRAKVGALVVSSDNHRVLAVGYNGGPKGVYNGCLSDEPGKCGHIHAEINALIKTNYHDAAQKKIYVTSSPCYNCAVAIVNANIVEVIYHTAYRDPAGLELLTRAKIQTRQHVPKDFAAWGL